MPSTSASANPGVIPSPNATTLPAQESSTQPVTPEDVKQKAEALQLSPSLYDPELIKTVVTPEDDPALTEVRNNYPNYQVAYGAQARTFQDTVTVELIQRVQQSYIDLMEQGATYDPMELSKGIPKQMSTAEFFAMLTNSGITQFPASLPTTAEVQNFTPTADAKNVGTYLGVAARQDSLNDQVTTWVARNDQAILDYNKAQTDPTKKLPHPGLTLNAFVDLGFADPNSSFGSTSSIQRAQGFMENPYDSVTTFSPEGGFIVNDLKKEDELGPNSVDIHGFTAVYNRLQGGKEVPVMGTFVLVPLHEAIVDGKIVKKDIVVPAMVWQTELRADG